MKRFHLLVLVAAAAGCGDGDTSYTINFASLAGTQSIACDTPLSAGGGNVLVRDFRLFVSNLELLTADGANALRLEQDGLWQSESLALLDFEEACGDFGNAELNTSVRGTAEVDGDVTGLRFQIGVPFERNHFDTATQPSPLNLASMFWNWRGGYKFIRIDLMGGDMMSVPFNVHLGSTACDGATDVDAPTMPCARPNRPTITLNGFDPASQEVVFDLQTLLTGSDTSTNTEGTPPGCMSAPTDPMDCTPVFRNLGLDFDSGSCSGNCDGQTFVRAR